MDNDEAITRMAALATPSRLDIIQLLAREGTEGLPSGELAKRLGVVQNTLSTQLLVLSNARLVRQRREGRSIIYRVDFEALKELAMFLIDSAAGSIAVADMRVTESPVSRKHG